MHWLSSDDVYKIYGSTTIPNHENSGVWWSGPSSFPWKPVWYARGKGRFFHLPTTATFILLSPLPVTFAFFRRRKRLKAISPSPLSRICPGCSYEFPAQQPQCPECGVEASACNAQNDCTDTTPPRSCPSMSKSKGKPALFTVREYCLLGASALCLILAGAFFCFSFRGSIRSENPIALVNAKGSLDIYWRTSYDYRKAFAHTLRFDSVYPDVWWIGPSTFSWKPIWLSHGTERFLRLPTSTTLILLSPLLATFAFFRRRKRLKAISPSPLSRICPGCSYEFPAQQPRCPECGVAAKSDQATAISE